MMSCTIGPMTSFPTAVAISPIASVALHRLFKNAVSVACKTAMQFVISHRYAIVVHALCAVMLLCLASVEKLCTSSRSCQSLS